MPRISAGLLLYRVPPQGPEVFLVHPGGPFWRNKDWGAWTIPKGEIEPGEDPLAAARREFAEETGHVAAGEFMPLPECRQAGGKIVQAWAVMMATLDPAAIRSNSVTLEWPPRSGRRQSFPEVDRALWFGLDEARRRINRGQVPLLGALALRL